MSSDVLQDERERTHQLSDDEDERSEESSDEDDDDDYNAKVKPTRAPVKELLKTALQQITDGTMDLTQDDGLKTFKSEALHDLTADTGNKSLPTALHMLLDDETDLPAVSDDQLKLLVTCLVQHPSNPLAKGDRDGKTPLYQAIDRRKEKMVEWMCDAHPNINTILSRPSNKKFYLHFAIKKKLECFGHMVKMADAKTLALRDSKGNSTLHLAVEHRRCRQNQLAIIQDIVARGDEEVRLSQGDFNDAGHSPYLHHKRTVEAAAKDRDEANAKAPGNTASGAKGRDRGRDTGLAELAKGNPAPSSPHDSNPVLPVPGQRRSVWQKSAVRSNSRAKYAPVPAVPQGPPGKAPNGDMPSLKLSVNIPAEPSAPSVTTLQAKEKSDSRKRSKVDEGVVKSVERFLKLHYLRSRSDGACMDRILYEKDKVSDLELFFDLTGRGGMTLSGFQVLLNQLKFEDALQYVAIPNIKIEAPAEGASTRRAHKSRPLDEGSGRRDLVQVFDGLRRKGVRTILKVVVDDSLDPPHTDEAIQESLRNLDVEVWDWKKTDLCSEVIYHAAPRVREVHLYWGGNNAVLRSWSEEAGLKRLSELRTVWVHTQKGIESAKRTEQYLKDFRHRINKAGFKHDLRLITDDGLLAKRRLPSTARARGVKEEQTSKHAWIDCMKKFRGLLLNAEQLDEYKQISRAAGEPIRVALIDDGVDGVDLGYPLWGGRTFCPRDEENRLSHPYYASAMGHGTAMAKLITFMCPRTQLYVLRLDLLETDSSKGARGVSARSAAQAITAAVKKKVHIISMSWTIDPTEDEAVNTELENAIRAADQANILMFCSASDQGAKQIDTYPSKATKRIFTIGAAGPAGETISRVGNSDLVDFTFPGDRVELLDGVTTNAPTKEVSGSSVATALAAGFAALVLHCVQVRLWYAPETEKPQVRRELEALRRHEQMADAFLRRIGTSPESKFKFLKVWNVFGPAVEERERYNDPDRLVELVARIGQQLCTGLTP